ncbi:MAG: inositol monophosphatase [Acidobacteria bacterium]|nr:MAG: inositol monophosphatase [Acidobacteriota bacterium]
MVRETVVAECEKASVDQLSEIVMDGEGDTIFAIDRVSEEMIVDFFETEVASKVPIVLIAEGIDKLVLPRDTNESDAVWRIIIDPIDGTRGLMYQKRSAWILTGVAPNRGAETSLLDIEFAIQTEIPLVKQHLSDTVWARRGEGVQAERYNRLTGESSPTRLIPSRADSIEQGFAMIARFFPGVRDVLAEIDEEIVREVLGKPREGKAQCFEDQYISTGGQLYELMAGHDRFVADIRPLMRGVMADRGLDLSICCHPYDLCTELIARELGVEITGVDGDLIHAPLNVDADVAWIGYANKQIRQQIEPALRNALNSRGLI